MSQDNHSGGHGSLSQYLTGFVLSIALTMVAYRLVVNHEFSAGWLTGLVSALAVAQLAVQLIYFLHLGRGQQSGWNIALLLFAILVVATLVGGSLWIMYHLDQGMTPAQIDKYLSSQDGL